MYIPKIAVEAKSKQRVFLALQGDSGTGKTTSALTAPNPIVADFDDNLPLHIKPKVLSLPFYSHDFMCEYNGGKYRPVIKTKQPNRRNAFQVWLTTEAHQLEPDQTLILDSWTTLQEAFDHQTKLEPVYTSNNVENEYAFWDRKLYWSIDIMMALIGLKCNVVVLFHEHKDRDSKGNILSKIAPLMRGQYQTQVKIRFPDWFRCIVLGGEEKDVESGKIIKIMEPKYMWQVRSDSQCDVKSRLPLEHKEAFVPANWNVFERYKI